MLYHSIISIRCRFWKILLCLTLSALLSACDQQSPEQDAFLGYVEAQYTYLSSPKGGYLDELAVQKGTKVQAGQPAFRLGSQPELAARDQAQAALEAAQDSLADLEKGRRPSEIKAIEAQMEQAQANLVLSRKELRRRSKLYAQKAIPKEQLDQSRTRYEADQAKVAQIAADLTTARLGGRADQIQAAKAQARAAQASLEQAQWALDQKAVNAPAGGLVFDTLYTRGEWVPAGKPVVVLMTPDNLKVRFYVPEPLLATLKAGQETALSCDGCPSGLKGHISYISPQVEYTPPVIYSSHSRAKLVYMVEARLAADQALSLHPGQPIQARPLAGE